MLNRSAQVQYNYNRLQIQ